MCVPVGKMTMPVKLLAMKIAYITFRRIVARALRVRPEPTQNAPVPKFIIPAIIGVNHTLFKIFDVGIAIMSISESDELLFSLSFLFFSLFHLFY